MADRFWVGGSGSWNSTTKWSATSGGASGASVPTASDNVIFDANSGAAHYIVTVTDNATCADFTFTPEPIDGVTQFSVGSNFVIAGTFSTSGTQGNRRLWLRSSTESLMRDVSIATIGTVTDVDFRDIRITGAGGTLTGTRIGDLKGNVGITFSAPKTVFRIDAITYWHDDQWAATSGGAVGADNFPLAQDTAVFDENTTAGTTTITTTLPYVGEIDMSARTSALTINFNGLTLIHGNVTLGSGVTITGSSGVVLSGRNTQVITSAGKTFSAPFTVNSFGGTVELADALNISTSLLTVTNGTFDTKGYNVTAGSLSSSSSNVREIKLGASTVTLSASSSVSITTSTNLTFDCGTSSIFLSNLQVGFAGGNQTFYNVIFSHASTAAFAHTIAQSNTFYNLTINNPSTDGQRRIILTGDQTITGTLSAFGASLKRRQFFRSDQVGTTRTLTVENLSANYCDFRDIAIIGSAAGVSLLGAGDCGGNSGIIFPAPKTVYWCVGGNQNWSSNSWAATSGGTPDVNNYPLAQDTAIIDDAVAIGTLSFNVETNLYKLDASNRTTSWNISSSYGPEIYGDLLMSPSATGATVFTMSGRGTQTITSNGFSIFRLYINSVLSNVVLADALTIIDSVITLGLKLDFGTFDAAGYNVTTSAFNSSNSNVRTLKMGSGDWTITGAGSVWNISASTNCTIYKGTANIILSNNTTSARTFFGGGLSYNKLTIGGETSTSTLTISQNNQFTELASTKTVAHTIALGTTTQTFGKWSVTGTAGNVVTVTGTIASGSIKINGSRVSGVDYLAMGTTKLVTTTLLASPAEFYAGANSTGTGDGIILEDAPTPVTRYWVGGTGTWNSSTTNWSATSGGAGGASVPTSADAVIFDSASNATSYTVTISTVPARCGTLTVDGPASGTVTLGSSTNNPFFVHDNITFAATGLASLFNMSGGIVLSGSAAGRTITTNGVTITANTGNPTVDGVGSSWVLGGAANFGTNAGLTLKNGSFSTANYSVQLPNMVLSGTGTTSLSLGSSTVTMSGSSNAINFGSTESNKVGFTFDAGTSSINISVVNMVINGNGHTFYNVAETGVNNLSATINGANTFNNLSFAGRTSGGISNRVFGDDQTINGTLTLFAGTDATMRTFVRSNTIGTTRTLTCAAVDTLTDIDFRDITIVISDYASIVQHAVGSLSTNPSVTTPSGLTSGNLLVLTGAISASFWDNLNTDLSTQSLTLQNTFADTTNPSVFVATRVIDGSEAASYSLTDSNAGRLVIMEIDGTFDVCGSSGKEAFALTYDITGITVSNSNSLLVAIGGIGHNDTLTMPSGMTSQFNTSADNLDPTLAVSYENVGSGATGVRTISRAGTTGGLGGVMFAVSRTPPPVTGTRLGDCKGNSGITFVAGANKYWNLAGGGSWFSTAWATSSGGAVSHDNFPLAQDTCIFEAGSPNSGTTLTLDGVSYNIGTIDMSARTTNTMTLGTGTTTPSIYGNWINGTGVTLSGTGTLTFAGRGSQTITSAGRTFTQSFTIDTPGGSVTLQDAFETNRADTLALRLATGTFDANNYNFTLSAATNGRMSSDGSGTRSLAVGSGTWTIAASATPWSATASLVVTGTGTISLTSASAKTFAGGGISYSGITLNQGGAGTLSISGNNTLANISSTATGATTISFGTTTQRVADFTASGAAGNVLTIQGSSATSPCTLIYTGAGNIDLDYLIITGVRAYSTNNPWYAGDNSTNNGSLGWLFNSYGGPVIATSTSNFFMMFN